MKRTGHVPRFIAILLCAVLLMSSLIGCAGSGHSTMDDTLSYYSLYQGIRSKEDIISLLPPGYYDHCVFSIVSSESLSVKEASEIVDGWYEPVADGLCEESAAWTDGVFAAFQRADEVYTPTPDEMAQLADWLKDCYGIKGRINDAALVSLRLELHSFNDEIFVEEGIPVLCLKVGSNWYMMDISSTPGVKEHGGITAETAMFVWMREWYAEHCGVSVFDT